MARKATYDQEKVKELRMSLIQAALDVMNEDPKVKKWSAYKKELILKMSPRTIPQPTEISGEIHIKMNEVKIRKYGGTQSQSGSE